MKQRHGSRRWKHQSRLFFLFPATTQLVDDDILNPTRWLFVPNWCFPDAGSDQRSLERGWWGYEYYCDQSPLNWWLMMWMQGSISVSMTLHQTSFCFVNSHLTSGHNKGDELKRNSDVTEILRRTKFPRLIKLLGLGLPETILAHEWAINKCFHFISLHFLTMWTISSLGYMSSTSLIVHTRFPHDCAHLKWLLCPAFIREE